MKVVLDTNVLLQCIAKNNIYRPIWDGFLSEKYNLVISVDILFEYIELLEQRTSATVAKNISDLVRKSNATVIIRRWIRWRTIVTDPDDNKFFDVAIASNADYIVTNDAHFDILKTLEFPKMNIITANEFLEIVQTL